MLVERRERTWKFNTFTMTGLTGIKQSCPWEHTAQHVHSSGRILTPQLLTNAGTDRRVSKDVKKRTAMCSSVEEYKLCAPVSDSFVPTFTAQTQNRTVPLPPSPHKPISLRSKRIRTDISYENNSLVMDKPKDWNFFFIKILEQGFLCLIFKKWRAEKQLV